MTLSPSPSHRLRPWVGLAALLLAGCGILDTRITSDVAYQYRPEEIGTVATGPRQLKVDIRQKPFAVPDNLFAATVLDSMQGRTPGRVVNFSIQPENPYPRGNYRTVLLFSPPQGSHPRQLCKAAIIDAAAPPGDLVLATTPGDVRVHGALCQGELALTYASGRSSQAPDVASPGFDKLMAQMTQALFPSENRNLDDDECLRNPVLCR